MGGDGGWVGRCAVGFGVVGGLTNQISLVLLSLNILTIVTCAASVNIYYI